MNVDKELLKITAEKAKQTLEKNLYEVTLNGIHYRRTVPSKQFYVHQWNWDSATHTMVYLYLYYRFMQQ